MRPLVPALLALSACAEPFDVSRDTLGPFRVAALGVVDGQAAAAVWAGQPLHESPVELAWTLDGAPLGEGWGVTVPEDALGSELGLVATAPDGTVREARVTAAAAPPAFSVEREAVALGSAWTLEDRLAADGAALAPGAPVPDGEAARLRPSGLDGATVQWRVAQGHGTLLRLTDTDADLLREDLTFDDGELEDRAALDAGMALTLAVALDGAGGNRWRWEQVPMGLEGTFLVHEGFRLQLDGADASTGLLAVTLADPAVTAADFGLTDPLPVDDLSDQEPLDCAPPGAAFRLAWLTEGRCALSEVRGARVVLEVE